MEISSTSTNFSLSALTQTSSSSSNISSTTSSYSSNAGVELSSLGTLMSKMSSMSDDEKDAAAEFRDSVLDSVEDGSFDAEELASSASDELIAYAEENGIDLEELANEIASGDQTPPPPPPSGGDPMSMLSSEEMEEAEDYRESILEAVESGEYDIDELVENAPDSVVAMAESMGVEVEDLVTSIANGEDPASTGEMPPPPPGIGAYQSVAGNSSSSTSDLLNEFLSS